MFIISGTRKTDRKLGYVADNCPACHQLARIEVRRVGLVQHYYWLSVGSGYFLQSYGICSSCGNQIPLEITNYLSIVKDEHADLIRLTSSSHPLQSGGAGVSTQNFERFQSIRAPFLTHGMHLNENAYSETKFDKTSGLAFLVTFAIPIGLGMIASYLPVSAQTDLIIFNVLMAFFGIGFLCSLALFFRHSHRATKKQVLPKIAAELMPLKPEKKEIEEVLRRLKKYGHRITHYLNSKSIMKALNSGG